MQKVTQKFFKTAGGIYADAGLSIATNEKRVFVTGFVSGVTALDFKKKVRNLSNPSSQADIFVAGLDHNGCQKFFKTAGGISEDKKTPFSLAAILSPVSSFIPPAVLKNF